MNVKIQNNFKSSSAEDLKFIDVIVSKQLKAVIKKFSLKINRQKMFCICPECNQKLHHVEKDEVRDLAPSYVFENCDK
ncbi:MAG: Mut7-C RNAse domain-containing protein [Smithella sp.]